MSDKHPHSRGSNAAIEASTSPGDLAGPVKNVDLKARSEIREQFLNDHLHLRGKCGVVSNLALNVLRGDEDLALALRLKGEELYRHLLEHMLWEEAKLVPILVHDTHGEFDEAALRAEHDSQRQLLNDSLAELRRDDASNRDLAKACITLVGWLDTDMATEERAVLRIMANAL